MTLIVITALLVIGPLLIVIAGIGLTSLLRWGASCEQVQSTLECSEFLGLFSVNPESLSFVGGGYALAFSILWAAAGVAILFLIGIVVAIARALS